MPERTQSGQAHTELTFRIQTGEIPAGEQIVEELWAERIGVNRAAICEGHHGAGVVDRDGRGVRKTTDVSADCVAAVLEAFQGTGRSPKPLSATPKVTRALLMPYARQFVQPLLFVPRCPNSVATV
jgi:hypothetical protein